MTRRLSLFFLVLLLLQGCSGDDTIAEAPPPGQTDQDDGPPPGFPENDTRTPVDVATDLPSPVPDAVAADDNGPAPVDIAADITVDAPPDDVEPDAGPPPPPGCLEVAKPGPVDDDPLPAMVPAGKVETQKGTFTDDYLWDGTGTIRVGTRREWGSSVVFFGLDSGGPGMNNTNVIDANDTGREVQIALYDPDRIHQGCAWNASCASSGGPCPGSISFLGWNPVQGGNRCNNGSGTESFTVEKGLLEAVVRPLHWNPNWEEPTCKNSGCKDAALAWLKSDVRYTQRLRFVEKHLVEMKMVVDNLSDVARAPTIQEFPTLYATYGAKGTSNLSVLLNSEGQTIAIDEPANDGFFTKVFSSPGTWCALQNTSKDYGVGIYYENRMQEWQGWQKAGVFNNVRSRFKFGLPALVQIRARAYLALGSYQLVGDVLSALDDALPPFGHLDAPAAEAAVTGTLQVSGWTLDNKQMTKLELLLDGAPKAVLPVDTPRPDVCAQWPGYAMCDTVGFDGSVSLAGVSACAHLVEVRATDNDGNARIIARVRVHVQGAPSCATDGQCDDGQACTTESCVDGACVYAALPAGTGPAEACNGVDDDCDGQIDEGAAAGCFPYYEDADDDGWGAGEAQCLCAATATFDAAKAGDCAAGDPAVNPGAPEVCNGKDDDCNGKTDDECDLSTTPVYRFVSTSGGDSDHMHGVTPAPLPGFTLEGKAFDLFASPGPGLVAMYQVHCPACTDHMPVTDQTEGAPAYGDPVLLGYCASKAGPAAPNEARRLYNADASDHFMSADPTEWALPDWANEWSCWVP